MRTLIIILLLTSTVYSQTDSDIMLFKDLNTYRLANGVHALKFNSSLYRKVSRVQLRKVIEADSLFHSHVTDEIVTASTSLPRISDESFDKFLKKYYNISYEFKPSIEDNQRDKLMTYITKYIIYKFHNSPGHKYVMLSDWNYFSSATFSIKDIKFNDEKRIPSFLRSEKNKKKIEHFEQPYYSFKMFACINFTSKRYK